MISAENMNKHRLVAGDSLTVVEGDDGVYYLSKMPNSSCEALRKTKASTKRFLADQRSLRAASRPSANSNTDDFSAGEDSNVIEIKFAKGTINYFY